MPLSKTSIRNTTYIRLRLPGFWLSKRVYQVGLSSTVLTSLCRAIPSLTLLSSLPTVAVSSSTTNQNRHTPMLLNLPTPVPNRLSFTLSSGKPCIQTSRLMRSGIWRTSTAKTKISLHRLLRTPSRLIRTRDGCMRRYSTNLYAA